MEIIKGPRPVSALHLLLPWPWLKLAEVSPDLALNTVLFSGAECRFGGLSLNPFFQILSSEKRRRQSSLN